MSLIAFKSSWRLKAFCDELRFSRKRVQSDVIFLDAWPFGIHRVITSSAFVIQTEDTYVATILFQSSHIRRNVADHPIRLHFFGVGIWFVPQLQGKTFCTSGHIGPLQWRRDASSVASEFSGHRSMMSERRTGQEKRVLRPIVFHDSSVSSGHRVACSAWAIPTRRVFCWAALPRPIITRRLLASRRWAPSVGAYRIRFFFHITIWISEREQIRLRTCIVLNRSRTTILLINHLHLFLLIVAFKARDFRATQGSEGSSR
jgi:hypothetical protein